MSNIILNNSDGNRIKGDTIKIKISIGIVLIIAVVIFAFSFSGSSVEKKIVGNWRMEDSEDIWSFTKNGQFINLSESNEGRTIMYSIDGDKLQLDIQYLWSNYTVIADIEISKNVLTMSNIIDPGDTMGVKEGEVIRMIRAE